MSLEFKGSPSHTVGVELEYQLVDRESRELVNKAPELLARFDGVEWVKPELLQSTIEINSDVCDDLDAVAVDLEDKVAQVRAAADELGVALVSAGTHPQSKWRDQEVTNDARYHRLVDGMQWPAKRLLIFGLHVHVGVPDGETAIAVVNHLERWLPHLLALSASSPYWQGHDTGLCSARSKIFEALPTAGLPYVHKSWDEFERLVEALRVGGAIESIREIWWDVRPHPGFGTVEVRVCDAIPTLYETLSVVALIQALIVYLSREASRGVPYQILHARIVRENKWRAARWSTKGSTIVDEEGTVEPISKSINDLIADLRPDFENLGSAKAVPRLRQMINEGSSHQRQRKVFEATGGDLKAVVDRLIREGEADDPYQH